jgi:hypothetical protein
MGAVEQSIFSSPMKAPLADCVVTWESINRVSERWFEFRHSEYLVFIEEKGATSLYESHPDY